jgi:hypothetical protein
MVRVYGDVLILDLPEEVFGHVYVGINNIIMFNDGWRDAIYIILYGRE